MFDTLKVDKIVKETGDTISIYFVHTQPGFGEELSSRSYFMGSRPGVSNSAQRTE